MNKWCNHHLTSNKYCSQISSQMSLFHFKKTKKFVDMSCSNHNERCFKYSVVWDRIVLIWSSTCRFLGREGTTRTRHNYSATAASAYPYLRNTAAAAAQNLPSSAAASPLQQQFPQHTLPPSSLRKAKQFSRSCESLFAERK